MDKERDTKVIKEIIDKVYGEEPTAVLRRRIPVEYRVICNEEVAKAIIEAGYGDTKQAVREFAAGLEEIRHSVRGLNVCFDDEWRYLLEDVLIKIDELLAEVIGK